MSYIAASVLQKNNDVYLNGGVNPGKTLLIPTPNSGGYVNSDYWATPIGEGIVSGYSYTPCEAADAVKPDPQSFHVVRIQSSQTRDDWYAYGTSRNYMDASEDAECCASPARDMPTAIPNAAACQSICSDANGVFTAVLGLPILGAGQKYFPFGTFNGVALTAASGAGYANKTALLAFLNANWTNGNLNNTWAVSSDNLTLTNTLSGGSDSDPDVLCARVIAIS